MTGGIPGGNSVPGYMAPPPAQKKGGNSWIIWLIVGCGGLVLLMIIGVVILASTFSNKISSSGGCSQNIVTIRSALERYQSDKGKYPKTLSELVPDYLPNPGLLTCGKDDRGQAREIAYTSPSSSAEPDAVVLSAHTGDLNIMQAQNHTIYIRLLKDGRLVQDQLARTELQRGAPFKASSKSKAP